MNGEASVVSLAGRRLRIEVTSPRARAAIAPAIAHLPAMSRADGAEALWTVAEEEESWTPRPFAGSGAYRMPDGGLAVVQNDPSSFEGYRPAVGIELRATPAAFAAGDLRAHPASHALAAWLAGPSIQVLHAGAVAYDGCAALIVGPGGVGKSTTVLACAAAGADYLGDDLCLVESGGNDPRAEPTVHCLFATAKLNSDSARAIGAESWPCLGVTPKNKVVVAVQYPLRIVPSARIVALIVLAPPVAGRPCAVPLRTVEALTAFAPTGAPLACGAGTPAAWFTTVAALARRVPAFRLPVSWELDALEAVVRETIAQCAAAAADSRNRGGEG